MSRSLNRSVGLVVLLFSGLVVLLIVPLICEDYQLNNKTTKPPKKLNPAKLE